VDADFQTLKKSICTVPILAYPEPGEGFVFEKDTNNARILRLLSQTQDIQEGLIAHYTKTLKKTERNYCITQRELLAIVRTLDHFHKYLYGQEFHLRTDHSALTWFEF
jgi:hypothetical protein